MQLPWKALVFRSGPEAGVAPPLVVRVELELEADGVFDAADETHAGVGLFVHGLLCVSCPSMV